MPRNILSPIAGIRNAALLALCAFLLLCTGTARAQDPPVDRYYYLKTGTRDFAAIKSTMDAFYAANPNGPGTGYKQWKRWEYDHRTRLTGTGELVNDAQKNLEAYQPYLAELASQFSPWSAVGNWTFMGPTGFVNGANGYAPGLGRLNMVAFHPTDGNTIYVGSPAGGLWRTTDAGSTWTSLTDMLPNLGVSGVAVHPTTPSTIYILTGDGDGSVTQSLGVYKSTNNGLSWSATALTWPVTSFVRGYKLLVHPTNGNILWAATTAGLYRTTNGGGSWTNTQTGNFQDVECKPGNPAILYASADGTFYRSTNTGASWTAVTSGIPSGINRMAIGVSPNALNTVYVLAGPATGAGTFKGVYRSTDSGVNFTLMTATPNILDGSTDGSTAGDQSGYDLAVAVSPTNADKLFTGGINVWESSNSGTTFTENAHWGLPFGGAIGTHYVHADIHDLVFNPVNGYAYCASDGGLTVSTDQGTNWSPVVQGLNTSMFYRIADYDGDPGLYIGGTQDNGSNKLIGGSTIMTHLTGADGLDCMIDHTDPNILYYTWQGGYVHRSTDGGTNMQYNIQPQGGPWLTPLAMDPVTPTILYGGWFNLFKSIDNGATWTDLGVPCADELVICQGAPNRIYCSYGNTISTSDNGGSSFTNISAGLPGNHITGIAVNPEYEWEVFVTVADFNAGSKVYYSWDAGTSWSNLSGSLPNIIVNCIAYDAGGGLPDDQLYIGTDVGVFYRDNTIGNWVPFNTNLPAVRVEDIEINEQDGTIAIGTFGRGIWRSELYGCLNTVNLSGNAPGGSSANAAGQINSTATMTSGSSQQVTYKAGHTIQLDPPFKVLNGSVFHGVVTGCGEN